MKDERRRYFRIEDIIGINFELLGSEEAKLFAHKSSEHGANFDYASHFDNRIQTLLETSRLQTPVAAELLDLLNKKLNFIIQQLNIEPEMAHKLAPDLRSASISACGIAFASKDALTSGQLVKLDMVLHPSELHVVAMAKVVKCTEIPPGDITGGRGYFLRMDLVEINPNDQELIIQHVVKRQSSQLKLKRNSGAHLTLS